MPPRDDPQYPDAKRPTVFADGIEFQDFVCSFLARHHVILQNLSSKKYQLEIGENLQGFEIKLDERCTETGRMSIEVSEKSRADKQIWTPSGIMREDNSWLYIQGNRSFIAVFAKNWLRRYFEEKAPEIVCKPIAAPTIKTFYIDMSVVRVGAIKCFDVVSVPALRVVGGAQ